MAKKQKRARAEHHGLTKGQKRNIVNIVGTSAMVVVLGLVLYAVIFKGAQRSSAQLTRRLDQQEQNANRKQSECPTRPGQPWEYDRDTQCHFDPSHGHWHLGQPPPPSERAAAMAGAPPPATPSPVAAPVEQPPPGTSPDGE